MNKKNILLLVSCILMAGSLNHCSQTGNKEDIYNTDTAAIASGEILFNIHCSGCHNFRQDGIGPQLTGITDAIGKEQLLQFIKNPEKLIASGNKRAKQIHEKFKGTVMPPFEFLNGQELDALLAFLHTRNLPAKHKGLSNPVTDTIAMSSLTAEIKAIATFPFTDTAMPHTRITKLDYEPETGSLFVVDLNGVLYRLHNGKPQTYLDIRKERPSFVYKPGLATGLGSFAFHPAFRKNGVFYTTHTEPPASAQADFPLDSTQKTAVQWILTEWKATQPAASHFSGSSRELLRVEMPGTVHGVQEIAFNPYAKKGDQDYGYLYIGTGDGGNSQTATTYGIWGALLRIDPAGNNSRNKQYGIPADNPFHDGKKKPAEVFAYGFRNAHRIAWTQSGKLLVSNIGQEQIESLNLIAPGANYGWPAREGTFASENIDGETVVFPLPDNDSIYHITYPVMQYDHDEGKAISGGFEYSGNSIPELKGKFLFGDIPTGRLLYVEENDLKQGRLATIKEWKVSLNGKIKTLQELCGSKRADLHFGKDMQGELYLLTKPDGKIYKLVAATQHEQ